MTKITCKIKDLQEICRLISMKGKNQMGQEYRANRDMLLFANGNRLDIEAIDTLKTLVLHLNYNIASVEEEGSIPIGDIERFEEFLGRFNSDDSVTLTTTENKIIIARDSPKKTLKIPKASISSIVSSGASTILSKLSKSEAGFWKTDKAVYSLRFTFDSNLIHDSILDGAVVKQREYPWLIEGDKLRVSIGSEDYGEIANEVPLESVETDPTGPNKKSTKTGFASGLDNLFGNIDGKVTVSLFDGAEISPLILEQKTDKFSLFAVLAPFQIAK